MIDWDKFNPVGNRCWFELFSGRFSIGIEKKKICFDGSIRFKRTSERRNAAIFLSTCRLINKKMKEKKRENRKRKIFFVLRVKISELTHCVQYFSMMFSNFCQWIFDTENCFPNKRSISIDTRIFQSFSYEKKKSIFDQWRKRNEESFQDWLAHSSSCRRFCFSSSCSSVETDAINNRKES